MTDTTNATVPATPERVVINGFRLVDGSADLQGRHVLAVFDCTVAGLLEMRGCRLYAYPDGGTIVTGPHCRSGRDTGVWITCRDLRAELLSRAMGAYRISGGRFAGPVAGSAR